MDPTPISFKAISDITICKLPIPSSTWHFGLFCLMSIFFGFVSVSCQKGNNEQETYTMNYLVDTVLIDSKERILYISGYMKGSSLDDDEGSFFLYNHHDLSIDEINLDRKEFVETYPLDAEGPNGVGNFILDLQVLDDNLFFGKSVPFSTVFDKSGRVIQKINWLTAKDSVGDPFGEGPPNSEVVVDTKNWRVMGTNLDFLKTTAFLGVLSVEDRLVKNINIDPENSFSNYFLKADNYYQNPWVFLGSIENYIYVSHEYSNEIIHFNPEGELVKVVNYEPKLTPRRANLPETLTGTREQIRRESRKLMEQVRFEAPVWDKVNRRYFRLSAKRIFEEGAEDEFLPLKKTHVFLTVFDAGFNLVSEIELKELFDENYKYFAKDGKLWICQNFSDELGFLVFDLKIN
ncbi:DUF4221 family protein [Aquiflexum sp.]|uniref:DUF4221 family protein n=1 Tax=Aquiflexum sp. TaxID=1872584 RepID=UPI00359398C8